MFRQHLSDMQQRVEGTVALSLVAADGIPIDAVNNDDEIDLEALAAELMAQVHDMGNEHQDLAHGGVKSFTVSTDRYTLMVGEVSPGYYLLLVLGEEAIPGKARFELRRASLVLADEL